MSLKYVQCPTLYLAGSGVVVGATSVTLTSLTDIYGNVLTMTNFGDFGYITFEPETTNAESATFTGITANSNGTYTLTGIKTSLAKSPYTETSGLVRAHSGGTKVVVTDTVAFWNTFTNKKNDETITGQWTFDVTPITPPAVSDASTTVKGVSKLSVAPASATNPIAVGTNDDRVLVGYAVDSVGTDAYAITPSIAITAYSAGQVFTWKAGTANTGACTLNVSGLGAKILKKAGQSSIGGSSTTQFDITNTSGTTYRYTYDGTGTDPGITATSIPTGTTLVIQAQNFNANNKGTFVVTGSGANYFEVTNAAGVAENNKTVGTGYINNTVTDLATGDILLSQIVQCEYDGSFMQMTTRNSLVPTIQVFSALSTTYGDTTSQFDVTNPSGTTFRYTYDGTGTDPGITSVTFPTGAKIQLWSDVGTPFNANNTGVFTITASGVNYFEVTNASGVVESNKVIGAGGFLKKITDQTYTPATGVKYAVVEVVGGGGGGAGSNGDGNAGGGGGGGGYAKKILYPPTLTTTTINVGLGGGYSTGDLDAQSGGTTTFGSILSATGGSRGLGSMATSSGAGGVGSSGDINIDGGDGDAGFSGSGSTGNGRSGRGGDSFLGFGGGSNGTATGIDGNSYGGGGSGAGNASTIASRDGGAGAGGVVIVTEYF